MPSALPLTHLGNMPVTTFLRDYWQQQPLLIRQAFPGFESPLTPDDLAGLALEEDLESRIVLEQGESGPWELLNGPFSETTFAKLPESHWTLLVQAVDQWVPEVHDLLEAFRFVPNWRLDDIMVSYAADQGSVGPHFDYYDVFLLQGYGQRHWHLGQNCKADSERLSGTALDILKSFDAKQDWILEPGDMLYVPPQIAHHGIAIGDSMTYSIGFRAPSHADILSDFAHDLAANLDNDLRYKDPSLTRQRNPGEINSRAVHRLRDILLQYTSDEEKLGDWFGRFMTTRKYTDHDATPEIDDQDQPDDQHR